MMSTKDSLENMARNTWLAGLGSIDSSKEALAKSIDAAQEKSNNLYNELLTRGEEIQSKFNHTKDEIQAKGKKLLGIGENESHEEKLAQLNTTVDHLTTVVVNLIEKRNAAATPKKVSKATPKTVSKAGPKTASKAAPKTASKVAPKTASKAAPKTTSKAASKVANKAAPKTSAKAEVSKAAPKTLAKVETKTITRTKLSETVEKPVIEATPNKTM